MRIHYYLSVTPLEALIASQLDPEQFGYYMSMGKKNGSYERIMFFEIEGGFGDYFDWKYAEERCVPHEDGAPKNSVWVSAYRALEHVEMDKFMALYLTTPDGRSLKIEPGDTSAQPENRSYYVYQEICPNTPLVVSALDPRTFGKYLTNSHYHISVPKVVFADLKTVDFDNYERTGNIGGTYDRNLEHLRECIKDVKTQPQKPNKNVERSMDSFSYQIIDNGIYAVTGDKMVSFPMPSMDKLRQEHFFWARSARIL